MPLRKRCAARIKPTIHNKRFSMHWFSIFRNQSVPIDNGSVKINIIRAIGIFKTCCNSTSDFGLQFGNRTNALHVPFIVSPNRQRCTPVTLSRYRPIFHIAQPLTKTPFSDPVRSPFYSVVKLQQALFDRSHSNKPGIHCVVEQRMVCSPAMWIIVQIGFFAI